MSKADVMFEELGYKEIKELKRRNGEIWGIEYIHDKDDISITFDLVGKEICVANGEDEAMYFEMQELKTINEKVKELQWI